MWLLEPSRGFIYVPPSWHVMGAWRHPCEWGVILSCCLSVSKAGAIAFVSNHGPTNHTQGSVILAWMSSRGSPCPWTWGWRNNGDHLAQCSSIIDEETDPERQTARRKGKAEEQVSTSLHVLLPPFPTPARPLSTEESVDWTSPSDLTFMSERGHGRKIECKTRSITKGKIPSSRSSVINLMEKQNKHTSSN